MHSTTELLEDASPFAGEPSVSFPPDWRPRVLLPLVLSVSACLALSRLESLVGRWSISSLLICFMLWNCLSICASHHWDSGKVCLNSLLAISGKRWSEQLHDKEAKYYFGKLGPVYKSYCMNRVPLTTTAKTILKSWWLQISKLYNLFLVHPMNISWIERLLEGKSKVRLFHHPLNFKKVSCQLPGIGSFPNDWLCHTLPP